MVNDGTPEGLTLLKGPSGENVTCWPRPHRLHRREHIDFIVFDASLGDRLAVEGIEKLPLPFQGDPKYADEGQRLSDHCPVVTTFATTEGEEIVLGPRSPTFE
jgi:hypothetical protein